MVLISRSMPAPFQFCASENFVATSGYPSIAKLLLSFLIYVEIAEDKNQQLPEVPSSSKATGST